jgi:AraC family transcriptional regulator of adaptative response / DNA-3-methyladenine glycosylase II
MLPEAEICQRARQARDPRFDGRFYVGVLTTGIYCRPVCPARMPAEENVRYFPSSASAQDAGFRPCLRCRPETARRLPEWTLNSQTVVRGLRMIDAGFLDDHSVEALADKLSISGRHLNRLFLDELHATPKSLARTRRVQLAKRLIDQSNLSLADVAMRAGFGSVRRFNDELKLAYGRSPRSLRGSFTGSPTDDLELFLPVRKPYHFDWVFTFLAQRALDGIEEVDGHEYRRALFAEGEAQGWLKVTEQDDGLRLSVPPAATADLSGILTRVRRVFDLDADPLVVEAGLSADPLLAAQIKKDPGLRVPGAWDGFEIAVRAILGQQVSVARATQLALKLCEEFGTGGFPGPAQLARADVSMIGMPGKRGEAVRALAAAVVDGTLALDESAEPGSLYPLLQSLPGIGPWTAGYIGMRVARDPDAFVDSDWVVLKMLETTAAQARSRAQAWRPWRAYAVMVLWRMSACRQGTSARRQGNAASVKH